MEWLTPTLSAILSIILATSIPLVLCLGLRSRQTGARPKGIGWQFIRYTVLAIALPLIGLLALNKVLTAEAATLIGTAMGFAFGKADERARPKKKPATNNNAANA